MIAVIPDRPQLLAMISLPGATLIHPVALCALAALILNDHVLKAEVPGWWTGKISDVAGLIVFPLALHSLLQLVAARRGSRAHLPGLPMISLGVAAVFAAVELVPPVAATYSTVLGALQWVPASLLSLATGAPADFQLVRATADSTDLLALPSVAVAIWIGRPRPSPPPGQAPRRLALAMLVVACLASLGTSKAAPSIRDGEARDVIVPGDGTRTSWLVSIEANAEALSGGGRPIFHVRFDDGEVSRGIAVILTRVDASEEEPSRPMRLTFDDIGMVRQPILGHCEVREDCHALYRLETRWEPWSDRRARTIEMDVSVSISYDTRASAPPGGEVVVELTEEPIQPRP